MKRPAILALLLVLLVGGCASSAPSPTPSSRGPRCGTRAGDEQRPLIIFFCLESP